MRIAYFMKPYSIEDDGFCHAPLGDGAKELGGMINAMKNWTRQIGWQAPTIFLALTMLTCPSALLANTDSVTVDVGELEAGKEVTVRFRATVANDFPATESTVDRHATVSGEDDGGSPFPNVTTTTSVPVARVLTQTSIDDFRLNGSSVGHIQLGQAVSVHVSVDSDPSGGPVPEGESVTVSGAGTEECVASLDASGEGSCELTPGHGGDQDIHASFTQTSEFEASTAGPVSLLVNRPPAFASTPVTEIGEGLPYEYTAAATDADGHSLSFDAVSLPTWLSLTDNGDNTTTLSGTPGLADVGDHDVVVEANDGFGGITQHGFTVTVTENNLPEITSDPVTEIGVLQSYSYTITAVDANDDHISLSVDGAPAWLDFNQTVDDPGYAEAELSGTPDTTDEGDYAIDVIANDGRGADVVDSFTLTVHPNNPPTFDTSPTTHGAEGLDYEYEVTVTDPDGDEITLSKDPVGEPWLDFVQTVNEPGEARGVLTGSPEMGDAGTYGITLNAEDERGESAQQSFTLEIGDNHPPSFISSPDTDAAEGLPYNYEVVADDPDGDELEFSISSGPSWLSLSPTGNSTAQLVGEPDTTDVGDHDVILEVKDGRGGVDTQSFTLTVQENQAPHFESTPVTEVKEGASYSYLLEASDPDGDSLNFTGITVPEWLQLEDQGDSTAMLSGTPDSSHIGDNEVTIEVADGRGGVDRQTFEVEVIALEPPEFVSDPVELAEPGVIYQYNVATSGNEVVVTARSIPGWMDFEDSGDGTAELRGAPGNSDLGEHRIELVAENPDGEVEQVFDVRVIEGVSFTSQPLEYAVLGETYQYAAETESANPDQVAIEAESLPEWLTLVDHGDGTASLEGIPEGEALDRTLVSLRAEYGADSAQQDYEVTILSGQESDPRVRLEPKETFVDRSQDAEWELALQNYGASDTEPLTLDLHIWSETVLNLSENLPASCEIDESPSIPRVTMRCEVSSLTAGENWDVSLMAEADGAQDVYGRVDVYLTGEENGEIRASDKAALHLYEGLWETPTEHLMVAGSQLTSGDFTRDGREEIIVANNDSGRVILMSNQGGVDLLELTRFEHPGEIHALVAMDVTNDDRPELIVGGHEGEVAVYEFDGGQFTVRQILNDVSGVTDFAVAKLGGENDKSLLIAKEGGMRSSLWQPDSNRMLRREFQFGDQDSRAVAIAKLSSDSAIIVFANQDQPSSVYEKQSDPDDNDQFVQIHELGSGRHVDVAAGDFDGDGAMDIAFAVDGESGDASSPPRNQVYFGDGQGGFSDRHEFGLVDSLSISALPSLGSVGHDVAVINRSGAQQRYGFRETRNARLHDPIKAVLDVKGGLYVDLDGSNLTDSIMARGEDGIAVFQRSDYLDGTASQADLEVVADRSHERQAVGASVSISVSIYNHGPDAAMGVELLVPFSSLFQSSELVTEGEECEIEDFTLTCDVPMIGAGESFDLALEGSADSTGMAYFDATVVSITEDPDQDNNADQIAVEFYRLMDRQASGGGSLGFVTLAVLLLLFIISWSNQYRSLGSRRDSPR